MSSDETTDDNGASNTDIKEIQRETGTLGQTIRETSPEIINSDEIKYVLNSIISAFDMSKLSDDDRNDIVNNLSVTNGAQPETDEEESERELAEDQIIDTGDEIPEESIIDESGVLNGLVREISRYDKSLAEKLNTFVERRTLRNKLKEINAKLSQIKEDDINNMASLENEDSY